MGEGGGGRIGQAGTNSPRGGTNDVILSRKVYTFLRVQDRRVRTLVRGLRVWSVRPCVSIPESNSQGILETSSYKIHTGIVVFYTTVTPRGILVALCIYKCLS